MLHLLNELRIPCPTLVLVEEDQEEGCRVGGAEVGGMRPLLEGGHLAPSNLMKDLSRLLVTEVVPLAALTAGEIAERGARELGKEWQRLQARDDAVATERRHEPRQAGGRYGGVRHELGEEPQRGQVDDAALVSSCERIVRCDEARRPVDPVLETGSDVRAR